MDAVTDYPVGGQDRTVHPATGHGEVSVARFACQQTCARLAIEDSYGSKQEVLGRLPVPWHKRCDVLPARAGTADAVRLLRAAPQRSRGSQARVDGLRQEFAS